MSRFAIAIWFLLANINLVNADEFIGQITNIDGDRIVLMKFGTEYFNEKKPTPPQKATLFAADGIKVNMGVPNSRLQRFDAYDIGEVVNDGLKNTVFKKAKVMARVTTENKKVIAVLIMYVQPDNEISAVVKKTSDNSVTFAKLGFPHEEIQEGKLLVADNLKVTEMRYNNDSKNIDMIVLEDGLKNRIFKKDNLHIHVRLITNDDNRIAEIRILPSK